LSKVTKKRTVNIEWFNFLTGEILYEMGEKVRRGENNLREGKERNKRLSNKD